jgi:hypothetical protein
MSVVTLRKELKWTRWIVLVMTLPNLLCYALIHKDFDKFRDESYELGRQSRENAKAIEELKAEVMNKNISIKDYVRRDEIMKSSFVGRKTKTNKKSLGKPIR